jgi:hypothetical protein
VPSPTEAPTQVSVAQEPQEVPTEPPAPEAATGDTATIRVLAQGDIDVTIVADGATVYSGWLGAGTVTEWYTASEFQVTTSNGGLTLFENAAYPDWDPFLMGEGEYVTFTLTP